MESKKCSKCNKIKSIVDFYYKWSKCKQCHNGYCNEYRLNHLDDYKRNYKKFIELNPDYNRNYYIMYLKK